MRVDNIAHASLLLDLRAPPGGGTSGSPPVSCRYKANCPEVCCAECAVVSFVLFVLCVLGELLVITFAGSRGILNWVVGRLFLLYLAMYAESLAQIDVGQVG